MTEPTENAQASAAAPDQVLRAVTEDGAFRVIAVTLSETTSTLVAAQKLAGDAATLIAELTCGAVIIRETMAPQFRAQVVLRAEASGCRMAVESHPEGTSRGVVIGADGMRRFDLTQGAVLEVQRALPAGKLHRGLVQVHGQTTSEAIVHYMQQSEQIICAVDIAVRQHGERMIASGYLVQLLPELSEDMLAIMTERLSAFPPVDKFMDEGVMGAADHMLSELLYGMPHAITERSALRFGCSCSEERVLLALSSMPRSDLDKLRTEGEAVTLDCDYCGKRYTVPAGKLQGLGAPS